MEVEGGFQMQEQERIILNELNQNVMRGESEKEEVKKGSLGTWKRIMRGERTERDQKDEKKMRDNGMKRVRVQSEEEGEENNRYKN